MHSNAKPKLIYFHAIDLHIKAWPPCTLHFICLKWRQRRQCPATGHDATLVQWFCQNGYDPHERLARFGYNLSKYENNI